MLLDNFRAYKKYKPYFRKTVGCMKFWALIETDLVQQMPIYFPLNTSLISCLIVPS